MKSTKLFFMGKRLKDVYAHATRWQVFKYRVRRFLNKCLWVLVLTGIVVGIFEAGSYLNPATIYTKAEVIKEVQMFPPILHKIARAESGDSHYCTQELVNRHMCKSGAVGQVLVNDTLDVGRYAININYNGKWCADRGYNIFDEKQNEQCALELFSERGSEPWSASKHNWNR